MPDQDDTDDGIQFPDELDRLSIDDADDDRIPDVDEVERGEDMPSTDAPTEEQVEEDPPPHEGFISDGLTRNEALALVGTTLLSYAFAWGVLNLMADSGWNAVPIYLWAIVAVLVLLPLLLMFGEGVIDKIESLVR